MLSKQGRKKMLIWRNFFSFLENARSIEYFYFDVDFDPKTKVLRSIFWSHASQRAEYKDFGDVITFDTTHKTNRKTCR